mgnify:CR=1 FL=1
MPRKIKVVDINQNITETSDNNDNVETKPIQNEPVEDIKEPIIEPITETIKEEPKEDIKDEIKDDVIAPPNTPKTKTKTQELIQCQRCKRWMTQKTLSFTHDKVCKEKADVYIPKTLQNKRNKAQEIVGTVKDALEIIEKEKQSKQPKIIEKPKEIIEKPQQIIRQSSEKLIQRLEPIQERTPLYSDLRKERIEKHNMKMSSLFTKAFN